MGRDSWDAVPTCELNAFILNTLYSGLVTWIVATASTNLNGCEWTHLACDRAHCSTAKQKLVGGIFFIQLLGKNGPVRIRRAVRLRPDVVYVGLSTLI